MKTFAGASDGAWQELLPGAVPPGHGHEGDGNGNAHVRPPQSVIDIVMDKREERERESPNSTVTTEQGKQIFSNYRLKQPHNGIQKQQSWISGSASRSNGDPTTTLTSVQKFAMKQTKIFPGRVKKRVVMKNGNVNLNKERIEKRHQRYLQDTFTTMVDIQWRWNLLVFALGFILSWLGFAVIWWVICFAHGDFEHTGDTTWNPCVAEVSSFASAFLFSIETQHTIGYGSRATTEECPEAIFIMCLQSITGVMIQCFVVGFVFAKLSRPQKRSQTLLFSRNAIVCMRDAKLCLMFRLGDVRNRSHIINPTISAVIIGRKTTLEGEVIPYYHTQLDVTFDSSHDSMFFIWPATMVHIIDENSPFYNMSADEICREKFEVIAILEGTIESTGQSVQARSSFLPSEILWGHRFEQLINYKKETGEYRVDYSKFNNTYEVDTPVCSAKDLYEYQRYVSQTSPFQRVSPTEFFSRTDDKTTTSSGDSGLSQNATNCLTVRSISNRHASGRSTE